MYGHTISLFGTGESHNEIAPDEPVVALGPTRPTRHAASLPAPRPGSRRATYQDYGELVEDGKILNGGLSLERKYKYATRLAQS